MAINPMNLSQAMPSIKLYRPVACSTSRGLWQAAKAVFIEALEARRLLSASGIPAMMGSTGINPTADVKSGAVLTDLDALNSTGTGTALLHLYPGDYCTSNLSQGMYSSGDDTVMLDCYKQNITPAISFEYYTTGGYAALLSYPWTSIGQTFAARYEPGGTWDQEQKAKNPNFNMNFGVTLYKAINEPDADTPAINAGNYATALQDLANGVHAVNASLQVVPGGFAYPNASGQIPNQPLKASLQVLINAIAPMLNNGTLAGIDLHTYEDATYGPVPGGFAWGAYSNFVKVKNDAVPKITADIKFYCSEFDYHLSGNATETSAATGLLTQIWDNLGVVGDNGEPITQLALVYTLNLTPATDSTNGMATQLSPWLGDERAQDVSLVAQLTNGMSFVSADPTKTGTYVLKDAAGDRKLWVWQDVKSWTDELGTSLTITNIPATATALSVYGWNGLRQTIPLSGNTSYTVTGLPGNETYMFLATTLPSGWTDSNIGAPTLPGSASLATNTFTITGSGAAGIGNASDQCNLASTNLTGDGTIIAEVDSLTDTSSAVGVMFRDSSAATSYFAAVVVTPGNGVSFEWRSAADPNGCLTTVGNLTTPEWVKLSRVGNTYTAYYSGNGTSWTQIGNQTIDFTSVAKGTASLASLAVTSDNIASYCTATFTNVLITNPPVTTASIAGTIYADTNDSGVWNAADPALNDVTVYIDAKNDGKLDPGDPSVNTKASGNYLFSSLAAGTYTVREVVPGNYTATSPATAYIDVTLAAGQASAGNTFLDAPTGNATQVAVYRLYSPVTLEHLYTTDLNEYNTLESYVGTWNAEGQVFSEYSGPATVGGIADEPYYRLYNPSVLQHLWTTDFNEYTVLGTEGWNQEGIVGYVFPAAPGSTATTLPTVPNSQSLYRLMAPQVHLWTTTPNEYDTLQTEGWTGEGIIGYVL